jgi:hypothetical protein
LFKDLFIIRRYQHGEKVGLIVTTVMGEEINKIGKSDDI